MAFDRRFALGLAFRLIVALAGLIAFAAAVATPGLMVVRLVALLFAIIGTFSLWSYIQRTNREVARFIEAVRFGDMQARFARPEAGSGFEELGRALDEGMRTLRNERVRLSEASRFFEALVDDAPIALLTVDQEGRVETANKAARKLFNRHTGVSVADFDIYGGHLAGVLTDLAPGSRSTIILSSDLGPQRAIAHAATLARLGGTVRVISVQVIQEALNAVEVAAQSDLIRVLTHEIMNSITPVTSLARTAAQLIADADVNGDRTIADARVAAETVARRAEGLLHFVESYRAITRPPALHRKSFAAGPFADELIRLFEADFADTPVRIEVAVSPDGHLIDADPDLLAQAIINLLRNAAEAAIPHSDAPFVSLSIEGMRAGRTRLTIADNGPGIPDALRHDIFLPFFTTKKAGTGVGLSLVRQIILAHQGTIEAQSADDGANIFVVII